MWIEANAEIEIEISDKLREILILISYGHTAKDVSLVMKCSSRTIESKLQMANKLLGCKNTTHLIAVCLRNKIID